MMLSETDKQIQKDEKLRIWEQIISSLLETLEVTFTTQLTDEHLRRIVNEKLSHNSVCSHFSLTVDSEQPAIIIGLADFLNPVVENIANQFLNSLNDKNVASPKKAFMMVYVQLLLLRIKVNIFNLQLEVFPDDDLMLYFRELANEFRRLKSTIENIPAKNHFSDDNIKDVSSPLTSISVKLLNSISMAFTGCIDTMGNMKPYQTDESRTILKNNRSVFSLNHDKYLSELMATVTDPVNPPVPPVPLPLATQKTRKEDGKRNRSLSWKEGYFSRSLADLSSFAKFNGSTGNLLSTLSWSNLSLKNTGSESSQHDDSNGNSAIESESDTDFSTNGSHRGSDKDSDLEKSGSTRQPQSVRKHSGASANNFSMGGSARLFRAKSAREIPKSTSARGSTSARDAFMRLMKEYLLYYDGASLSSVRAKLNDHPDRFRYFATLLDQIPGEEERKITNKARSDFKIGASEKFQVMLIEMFQSEPNEQLDKRFKEFQDPQIQKYLAVVHAMALSDSSDMNAEVASAAMGLYKFIAGIIGDLHFVMEEKKINFKEISIDECFGEQPIDLVKQPESLKKLVTGAVVEFVKRNESLGKKIQTNAREILGELESENTTQGLPNNRASAPTPRTP